MAPQRWRVAGSVCACWEDRELRKESPCFNSTTQRARGNFNYVASVCRDGTTLAPHREWGRRGAAWHRIAWRRCRTLSQNHKRHSIALLVPFVSKKGTNRGIKCQFNILEKNPKGGPFYVKNFFVSDSAQISCVKSLGHKDFKFWISSKSETKKFFFSKGGTLWCFSRNRDFENQKNVKGPDLWKKKNFFLRFWWNSKFEILMA